MEAVFGAVANPTAAIGNAFGLSPEMIKALGGADKESMAAMQGAAKSATPGVPQMPRATPRPVDIGQLLAALKERQNLGT